MNTPLRSSGSPAGAGGQTVAQIEFYWPTYNPVEALDFFEQTPVEKAILREGEQIDYPGNTTGAVYEWMRVNGLHVFATKLVGQRRRGRWEGYYRVTFAQAPAPGPAR